MSIFGRIEGKVETIFGDTVARIEQLEQSVRVTFERGIERDFDLVVGADGLHLRVRELIFGEQSRFENYLGMKAAAFEVAGYRPRDELAYVTYTEVGQQVGRFAMRGDRTMFLFTFVDDQAIEPGEMGDVQAQKALLHRRFGKSGWECPQILDALDACNDLYFDRVSQIRMDPESGLWSRGRVTLIGDAASCVSLLGGEGAGLAMLAAYILAGELYRERGGHAAAFARYHKLFAPFVRAKQKAALRSAGSFAPRSKLAIVLRNQVINLMRIQWVADRVFGDFTDEIVLPEY